MTFIRTSLCTLFSFVLSGAALAADPVDELVEKITAADAQAKSGSAKTRMIQDMDLGDGASLKAKAEGTVEWMRKGDKKMFRSDTKMSGVQKFSDQEIKIDQTVTMISDGEFAYTISDDGGQKSAYKTRGQSELQDDAKLMVEQLKEGYTLKVLPDEKVEGADCWVLEATAKAPEEPMVKQTLHFRKDSGMNVKMIGRDKSDKVVFSHELQDVKLNTDVPADRFVFKAPPGVEVMDMTQQEAPTEPGQP